MIKSLALYRRRVSATWRQSFGAGLAGLALSHTIARAMWAGVVSGRLGFFRTPKLAGTSTLLRVLGDAREEVLLMIAFWLGAFAVMQREDAYMIDVQVWAAVLLVQSVPYFASLVMSLISAMPRLPASLIGPLAEMQDGPSAEQASANTGRAPSKISAAVRTADS